MSFLLKQPGHIEAVALCTPAQVIEFVDHQDFH
jgi:hypothetical protein